MVRKMKNDEEVFIFNSSPNVEDKGVCKWVSVDCHQSSLGCPGPRPGCDIGAKAPYPSCVISRTHPGPAPGAQFLCSNLSSLLRASLSLLFFVQSQLGHTTTGGIGGTNVSIMSGSCSDIGAPVHGAPGDHDHVTKVAWLSPNKLITTKTGLWGESLSLSWRTDIFLATKLTSWMDNLWVSLIPTKGIWGGEIF